MELQTSYANNNNNSDGKNEKEMRHSIWQWNLAFDLIRI